MTDPVDLWGDLDPEPTDAGSPTRALLQTQAALLDRKTGGAIDAMVEVAGAPGTTLKIKLVLTVPALDGDRYELLHVMQRQLEPFPAELVQGDRRVKCADGAAFEAALADALRSAATRRALNELRALAKDATG